MTDHPRHDEFGLPIGPEVPGWQPADRPPEEPMAGRHVRLERLRADVHGAALLDAFTGDDGRMWTYLPWGPCRSPADLGPVLDLMEKGDEFVGYALTTPQLGPAGLASYLRMDRGAGSVEVGGLAFGPALRRTSATTEAMFLMADRAFDSGFRRYEWKCDALNAASRAAATRLGFTYEGTFRQAMVYKGRNRDTAWFSILDSEWPTLRQAHLAWLDPANFDVDGTQRQTLGSLVDAARSAGAAR